MDAPFKVGDIVVCVRAKPGYLLEGGEYTITSVDLDGCRWFVTVRGVSSSSLYADRFQLVGGTGKTKVERKIKQMEQRFIKRQQEKKNESMCCV